MAYKKPPIFTPEKLQELSKSYDKYDVAELLGDSERYLKDLEEQIYGRDALEGGSLISRATKSEKAKKKLDPLVEDYKKLKAQIDTLKEISGKIKTAETKAKQKKKAEKDLELATSRLQMAEATNAIEGTTETSKKVSEAKADVNAAKNTLSKLQPPKPTAKSTGKRVVTAPETARQGDITPSAKVVEQQPETPQETQAPAAPAASSKKGTQTKKATTLKESEADRELTAEQILDQYQFIDAIIEQDPKLKQAYLDFVKGKITQDRFKNVVVTSDYVAKNSQTIRQRKYNKAVYEEMGPEDQASGNSQYAQDIFEVMANVKTFAKNAGAAISDTEARTIADRLYMLGQDRSEFSINAAIRPFIRVGMSPTGATVGGAGGQNYRQLLDTAFQNGIATSEIPSVLGYRSMDEILQAINAGESPETFQQGMRNYASTGQSDFVKNQLGQGVNLRAIANPYIVAMQDVLELQPDTIKLNDSMVQLGLQNNGMNIFDFKKLLRKDPRWQYTKNAEQDVSNATMRILRDFGFEA